MAISKNSTRVQFTLNTGKKKEEQIAKFLDSCINPNSTIKEIIYNYIVSNGGAKSPQVTHCEIIQSDTKLLTLSESEQNSNNMVTQSEEKSPEVSELELNEMEELKKFIQK